MKNIKHVMGLSHNGFLKNSHDATVLPFKLPRPDNYLDYNNSKRHTWHWQWENAFDYPDLTIE